MVTHVGILINHDVFPDARLQKGEWYVLEYLDQSDGDVPDMFGQYRNGVQIRSLRHLLFCNARLGHAIYLLCPLRPRARESVDPPGLREQTMIERLVGHSCQWTLGAAPSSSRMNPQRLMIDHHDNDSRHDYQQHVYDAHVGHATYSTYYNMPHRPSLSSSTPTATDSITDDDDDVGTTDGGGGSCCCVSKRRRRNNDRNSPISERTTPYYRGAYDTSPVGIAHVDGNNGTTTCCGTRRRRKRLHIRSSAELVYRLFAALGILPVAADPALYIGQLLPVDLLPGVDPTTPVITTTYKIRRLVLESTLSKEKRPDDGPSSLVDESLD